MLTPRRDFLAAATTTVLAGSICGQTQESNGFLFDNPPFPSCHASTVVELTPDTLLAAYFAGTDEGNPDVGIFLSRGTRTAEGKWSWSAPELAHREPKVPCWNPVLFLADAANGSKELLLFFKAGVNPREWSGLLKRSTDLGKTWSNAELLPAGILGPVRAKPVQLSGGRLICGTSAESYNTWTCWIEITNDLGRTWTKHGPIYAPGKLYGCIQPAPFVIDASQPGKEHLAFIARSRGLGKILRSESRDGGVTWSPCEAINLPNPNAGVDAVSLPDGRVVAIYNHSKFGRTPLQLAISTDGGKNFTPSVVLENQPGEYSYPALILGGRNSLHATYTWKRTRIKHHEIPLDRLKS